EVELARDPAGALDEQASDDAALRPRLVGHERLAEQRPRRLPGLAGVPDDLHATRLAASAGVDLRLHHARELEPLGRRHRLVDREARLPVGNRHLVAAEQLLRLMLVYVHKSIYRGPVRCSGAARPALLRCPRTPSLGHGEAA